MAFPSVTYSFSNGAISDGTQLNTNFTDLENALSLNNRDIAMRNIDVISCTVSNLVHVGSACGFYGVTAISQAGAVTAPTTVTECISACASLITVLQNLGLTA